MAGAGVSTLVALHSMRRSRSLLVLTVPRHRLPPEPVSSVHHVGKHSNCGALCVRSTEVNLVTPAPDSDPNPLRRLSLELRARRASRPQPQPQPQVHVPFVTDAIPHPAAFSSRPRRAAAAKASTRTAATASDDSRREYFPVSDSRSEDALVAGDRMRTSFAVYQ